MPKAFQSEKILMDPERTLRAGVRKVWKRGQGGSIESKAFVRPSSNREKKKEEEERAITSSFSPGKNSRSPASLFSKSCKFSSAVPFRSSGSFSPILTYSDCDLFARFASLDFIKFLLTRGNRAKRRSHQRGARNFLPTDKRERFGLALPMQSRRRPR